MLKADLLKTVERKAKSNFSVIDSSDLYERLLTLQWVALCCYDLGIGIFHNCDKLPWYKRRPSAPGRSVSPTFFPDSLTRRTPIKTTSIHPIVREDSFFKRLFTKMPAGPLLLSVTLASIILSGEAIPYLASRLMGFGQNFPDSAQNFNQFGQFRSGVSQLNSNGAVSPSFPTAPYEGVNLVNNGTGLNIAYQGMPS